MPKFRKKPVIIEARQWDGEPFGMMRWVESLPPDKTGRRGLKFELGSIVLIDTPEGEMAAQKGDWIICGIKNELYPCKPDIFAATYDPA